MTGDEVSEDPYESVLVGYFCQAVGWIMRDSLDRNLLATSPEERFAKAINLSHNPLDPAVGDLILHMDETETLPSQFFIFELKRRWSDGLKDERRKFRKKNNNETTLDGEFVATLLKEFPKARTAHLFGALRKYPSEAARKSQQLFTASYWNSLTNVPTERLLLLKQLHDIVSGACNGKGFTFGELAAYIEELNKNALPGSMAGSGSARFAVAYKDQQLYAFDVESVLELRRERMLKQQQSLSVQPSRRSKGLGL